MDCNLKGFHAIITGGSSGMGFEMAKTLLSHGATVAIAARGGTKLENACLTLKNGGFDVHALEMDVRSEESVATAASWIAKNWERLDMLVNNAGIGMRSINKEHPKPLPFYEIQPEDFNNLVQTNFTGYFLVMRAFVPLMLPHKSGRIVNVSTSIPTMTLSGQLPYGPARAAAEAMSVIVSKELEDLGITVNVLLPGGATLTGFMPEEMHGKADNSKFLPASIMNEAILFLASDKAVGMTGERIIAKEFHQWLKEKGLE